MDLKLLAYIPKKFRPHVQDTYRDCDGIWIEGDKYMWNPLCEFHGIHCDTIRELREEIKSLVLLKDGDPNCVE